jgi:hypothetical protein
MGCVFGRLDATNLLYSRAMLLFSAAFLWPIIRTVRNEFSNFIKPAIFILILLGCWRLGAKYILQLRAYKMKPHASEPSAEP